MKADDGAEKIWYLQVSAARPCANLALSWPDLSALPETLVPILEDTTTSGRYYMRTTAALRFDMAQAGTRLFKILVRPAATSTAVVSALQAQATPGGSYEITYTLSAPAEVGVQVRNIAGVVIKTLASTGPVEAGVNTLAWNGRADSGTRVPAGRYLCQLTARSPETGQSSSLITTFVVTR